MALGKMVKDCWGKNEVVGKMKKEKDKMGFPLLILILLIYNHHLQCVSYFYKPCRLVKNSLKWCKNSSFKVENLKIFLVGYAPPPCTPRSGCGEAGKGLLGEKIRGWEK